MRLRVYAACRQKAAVDTQPSRALTTSDERWSCRTHYQHIRRWVMGTVAGLIYALLQPSCQCGSAPRILLSPGWEDWEGEGGGELKKKREGKKITVAKRGFSTSSLTKSHHFRRLTSACDKCSTSSCLPISLELETPEASAACKIKKWSPNSVKHKIHFWREEESRRKRTGGYGGRGDRKKDGLCHQCTTSALRSQFASINYC